MSIADGHFFKTEKVKKGSILLHKGNVCKCAYKVLTGCLKSYVIDNAGKEHIIQFAPEEWFIVDMDSFINNKATAVFIDAIEDSEVAVLHRAAFENINIHEKTVLLEQNSKLLRNLIAGNKRLISLLSSTAVERYMSFMETYPALSQRLPLKLIAAYIGVTPEYLSDIRRKISKQGSRSIS